MNFVGLSDSLANSQSLVDLCHNTAKSTWRLTGCSQQKTGPLITVTAALPSPGAPFTNPPFPNHNLDLTRTPILRRRQMSADKTQSSAARLLEVASNELAHLKSGRAVYVRRGGPAGIFFRGSRESAVKSISDQLLALDKGAATQAELPSAQQQNSRSLADSS
ncbi:hypothetical protein HaLaN_32586 [Haematococcus lacustris]|uniref:Uncharacterized protein n=1 Tax=Haematococcus lacustris TaxID=44745 RepID=A0A6A0AL85_HAELA|nr:hypothetical protein HaLaN_32586 [Haematococcus lacustris]